MTTRVAMPIFLTAGPAAPTALQEALQITGQLVGTLKDQQMSYLRVGSLLARVRDERLYEALHYPDMESYAAERLLLGRSSLYRYLRVYDWVKQYHPEWLVPHPQGHIPDLTDIGDLIWIEHELTNPKLDPKKRAALEELRKKALVGKLKEGELSALRRRRHGTLDGLSVFLAALKALRSRGAKLVSLPSEVLSYLDSAIEVLSREKTLRAAGFEVPQD